MTSDRISLTGLRVRGHHGLLAAERELGQEFVVDATVHLDTRRAVRTDDVAETADYAALATRLAEIVAGEPVNLIETLAARLADACLADARVQRAEITVHKPSAPIPLPFTDVAVTVTRDRPPAGTGGRGPHAVLALGSNLGDRHRYLAEAARALGALACSAVYETDPVGGPEQDSYLNAVVLVPSAPPRELLAAARAAEAAAHRERGARWGPRTLDVDVIAAGDVISEDPEVLIPHPRAHLRAFVCVPWLDVDPDATLPGHGHVADIVARLQVTGVRHTGLTLMADL